MMRIDSTSLHGIRVYYLLFFLLLFIIPHGSHSNVQTKLDVDSLIQTLNTPDNDSLRIESLMEAAYIMEVDTTSSIPNPDTLILLATLIAKDSVLIDQLARSIDNYGVQFRKNGDYLNALRYHNLAKEVADKIDNKNINSIISNNIGVVYRRLDDYQQALGYHITALNLAEETRNVKSQAIAINSIGNIQMMIGNLDEALESFKQSLILEQKLDNMLGIAINLNNIGNVYIEQHDYAKALEYFNLSLDVNKEIKSQRGIAICYTDIGRVYEYQGNSNRALSFYLEALMINRFLDDKHSLAFSYLQVGELYTEIGNYSRALEYLEPGLELALNIGSKAFIMDCYAALYRINRANKNYESAFNFLELSHQYHDSILDINIRKDIARLQIQYESERKESQIALLEQNAAISELADKREEVMFLLILSALVIAIGIVIFLSYYLYNKSNTNKLLLEQNRNIEKAKKELDSYSKQLLIAKQEAERNSKVKSEFLANMSHEIRTPLNSVIGFADILVSSVKDPNHLNKLNVIKSSGRTLLTLINDILDLSKIEAGKFTIDYDPINPEFIFEDVIQIFSHRSFEKNIELVSRISDQLPPAILFNELRLRQILFNIIGNAIKFTKEGKIVVEAIVDQSDIENRIGLTIKVSDSGIGINTKDIQDIFEPFHQSESNRNENGTGLGLTITKRLVEMLDGTINVSSEVGVGTTFTVSFPSIKIVEDEIEPDYHLPSVKADNEAKVLILTADTSKCIVFSQLNVAPFEKEIATNLDDAKAVISEKNVVIICNYTVDQAMNAIKLLRKCYTINKLHFIVITKEETSMGSTAQKDIYWVVSSASNTALVRTLNGIFKTIETREKYSSYFSELLNYDSYNVEFINEISAIFNGSYSKSRETKMSGAILHFTKELQVFATKYNFDGLIRYCSELNNSANHFEIDEVDKLLQLFETNYNTITP